MVPTVHAVSFPQTQCQGRQACGQGLVLPKVKGWRVLLSALPLEAQRSSSVPAALGTGAVGSKNPVRPSSALPFSLGFWETDKIRGECLL